MSDYGGYNFDVEEGPLTGRLVKVVDLAERLQPLRSLEGWVDNGEEGGGKAVHKDEWVSANGFIGQALLYDGQSESYAILTFDRLLLRVPERNLREWDPPEPEEEDGCDLVWPNEYNGPEAYQKLAEDLVLVLQNKGYCVVQLWASDDEREAVTHLALQLRHWHLPAKAYEPTYVGIDNYTKLAVLPAWDEDMDPRFQAIAPYQEVIADVAVRIEPFAQVLGHELSCLMNGMLRMPMKDPIREAVNLRPPLASHEPPEDEEDLSEATKERLGHAAFLERRTLMMMCTVDNTGGELVLIPRADLENAKIRLPLSKNKLIIFNNILLSHKYAPLGEWSTALQTWVLKDPSAMFSEDIGKGIVALPTELTDRRVHINSTMVNYPGQAQGPQSFWVMASVGTDAQTKVPISRFDIDAYYDMTGKDHTDDMHTYALHGSFTTDAGILFFDNTRFQISDSETKMMSPGQRLIVETGYEALYRASFTKDTMQGMDCGVFLGDSGSVWVNEIGDQNGFRWAGTNQAISGYRLSHILGLVGPCTTVDTACSSSLVAVSLAHNSIRPVDQTEVDTTPAKKSHATHTYHAMALGNTLMLTPKWFVLYCGPKMLSPRGRCFTFDSSADGFARGEGCGAMFYCTPDPTDEVDDMLGVLVGSAANQDGRSASMTAPHGPSQQQCILSALKEHGLNPSEMSMAECHGTGTALGDPIEVSALRMVMQKRESPIFTTSAKTLVGHLEAAAGLAGLVKCVLSVLYSTAAPNAHFNNLNPHLDVNGYPVYFTNEAADFHYEHSLDGVSSFGFGGTNARGDIWGRCQLGGHATEHCANAWRRLSSSLRYERMVEHGTLGPQAEDKLMALGSWDGFRTVHSLDRMGMGGEFSFVVIIGETRRELFVLVLNETVDAYFRPAHCNADQEADIIGPDAIGGPDKTWWMIDAKYDGCPAGTVYRITFTWKFSWEHGEYKSIWWEPYELPGIQVRQLGLLTHSYFIVGSWTSWATQEMFKSKEEEGLWYIDLRVGLRGEEEFQFSRDADWRQVIYPAVNRARKTSIPIRGPDNMGEGKCWLLRGPEGEAVTIQLRIMDGEITVTTSSLTKGVKVWQTIEDAGWSQYFVTGSFNQWGFGAMESDAESTSFYRFKVQLGPSGEEEFQIVQEKDWQKRLYPSQTHASLGEAPACGPDEFGQDDMTWLITGRPGQLFEICLDMEQTDSNWMVWWTEVEPLDDPHGRIVEVPSRDASDRGDEDEGFEEEEGDEEDEEDEDDETGEIFVPRPRAAD